MGGDWNGEMTVPSRKAKAVNTSGAATQAEMNSAGFIVRSARARSVASLAAKSLRSSARLNAAVTAPSRSSSTVTEPPEA
jgi:hypothetical protein